MLCKVTKRMVKELNKEAKNHSLSFVYRECTPEQFSRIFSDWYLINADYYGDFDYTKGVCKYIAVVYPAEYYAMNNYLTTYDLIKLNKAGFSVADFVKEVCCAMEV